MMLTPGTTMIKARRTNTYETRPLILRTRPGATTTLRRAWMMKSGGRRPRRSHSIPLPHLLRKEKTMHAEQIVADMADEVLARQAQAHAKQTGEAFEDALESVLNTEAGRQLRDLRDGPHGCTVASQWKCVLIRRRRRYCTCVACKLYKLMEN